MIFFYPGAHIEFWGNVNKIFCTITNIHNLKQTRTWALGTDHNFYIQITHVEHMFNEHVSLSADNQIFYLILQYFAKYLTPMLL